MALKVNLVLISERKKKWSRVGLYNLKVNVTGVFSTVEMSKKVRLLSRKASRLSMKTFFMSF